MLRRELRYQTFRRYCELNVALELSAELAYERLVELARDDQERKVFDRIRDDEARHAAAFRALGEALTDDDHVAEGVDADALIAELARHQPVVHPGGVAHERHRTLRPGLVRLRWSGGGPQRHVRRRQARGAGGHPRCGRAPGLRLRCPDGGGPGVVHARLRPAGPLEHQRR